MKKLLFFPALLGVLLITSCGPSAAEVEAKNQAIADSIATVEAANQKMIEDSIAAANAAAEEAAAAAAADTMATADAGEEAAH